MTLQTNLAALGDLQASKWFYIACSWRRCLWLCCWICPNRWQELSTGSFLKFVITDFLSLLRSSGDALIKKRINWLQLCNFAIQMAEGMRYLEKYSFIHRRMTFDICLLCYDYNIKIAVYGLTAGELCATSNDLTDIELCRWDMR